MRAEPSHDARTRRRITRLAAAVATEFAVLGLQQFGVIKRVPDLPFRGFDANAVMRAPVAYPFGVPDSVFATAGAATIAVLARRRADRLLGIATLTGAGAATFFLHNMATVQRRVCIYCVAASIGLFTLAAWSLPLAVRAFTRNRRSCGRG
jgi:uncharacterized membrane protein